MTSRGSFQQTTVTKLLRATKSAVDAVDRIEVKPDGSVCMFLREAGAARDWNEWDEALYP